MDLIKTKSRLKFLVLAFMFILIFFAGCKPDNELESEITKKIKDKPFNVFQKQLPCMDIQTVSFIPMNPYLNDSSKAQQAVEQTSVNSKPLPLSKDLFAVRCLKAFSAMEPDAKLLKRVRQIA